MTESGVSDNISLKRLREHVSDLGPTSVTTTITIGAGTMSTLVLGGAQLGVSVSWMVAFTALAYFSVLILSAKTTCATGQPPLHLLKNNFGKLIAVVGGLLIFIPGPFFMAAFGIAYSQVGSSLTGLPANIVIWPLLLPLIAVYCLGSFKRIELVASVLLIILLVVAIVVSIMMFFTPRLSFLQAASGLVRPDWPDNPFTATFFAGLLGSAAIWILLAYQGYAIYDDGRANISSYTEIKLDIILFGFVSFVIFTLGVFLAAAGAFYGNPAAPSTIPRAAQLFVPVLGDWSFYLFYLGFLAALFTSTGGFNNLVVQSFFATLDTIELGYFDWRPEMENRTYQIGLVTFLIATTGIPVTLLQNYSNILEILVIMQNFTIWATPPALVIWIYFTNKESIVGEHTNSIAFNILLVFVFIGTTYATVRSLLNFF